MTENTKNTVLVATGAGLAVGAATLAAGPGTALAVAAASIGLGGMAGNLLSSGIGALGSNFQRAVLDRFSAVAQSNELTIGLNHATATALRRVIETTFSAGKADSDLERWCQVLTPFLDAALAATPEVAAPTNVGDIAVTIARGVPADTTGLRRELEDWALADLGRAVNVSVDQFPPEFVTAFRGNGTAANPGWFNQFREMIVRQQARDERFAHAWQAAIMALLLEAVRAHVDGGSPPLDPGPVIQSKPTGLDRFVYTRRWTSLVGRDAELARLLAFSDPGRGSEARFMLIAGPGGRGKSRLALEACELAAKQFGMFAGFLSPRAAPAGGWAHWKPSVPTLIVIDYAASRAAEVHDMLVALTLPGRPQSHPVRVLLLEREAGLDAALAAGTNLKSHRTWIDIISGGSSNEAQAIEAAFDGELILEPVVDPWPIMEMVFAAKGKAVPTKADSLAALRVVDPSRSPLFAILVADALADSEAIGDGDRYQFLRRVIHKQSVLPSDNVSRELALNNAAVATLSRHVQASGLLRLYENYGQALAPRFLPADHDMEAVIDAVAGLTGHRDGAILHGLEPDLLGEVLILSRSEPSEVNGERRADTLRELAWRIPRNNPPAGPIRTLPLAYGAAEMLRLCCSDFPEETIRSGLLEAPVADGDPALSSWVTMIRGIISSLIAAGRAELALVVFSGAVMRAVRRNGASRIVANMRLSAAADIAARLYDAGDYRGAVAFGVAELGRPADRTQEDEFAIRSRLALAEHAIFSALATGDITSAMQIYRADLLTAVPIGSARHGAWIVPVCARAIANAMVAEGDLDGAEGAQRNEFRELKNTSEIARDVLIGFLTRGDNGGAKRILEGWPDETEAWKAIELAELSAHEKQMQDETHAHFQRLLTPEVAEQLRRAEKPKKDLSRTAEWQADRAAGAYALWFFVATSAGLLRSEDFDDGDYVPGWPRREGRGTKKWMVFFDYAKARITSEGRNTVCGSAAAAMAREQSLNPEFHFSAEIIGRTDTAELPNERAAFSLRRAEAVARLLIAGGLNMPAITIRGIGVEDPMTPSGEGVREPKNRRATIEISHARLPPSEPLPTSATSDDWVWLNRFFREEIASYAAANDAYPIPSELARKAARHLATMRQRVRPEWLTRDGVVPMNELDRWLGADGSRLG